MRTDRESRLRRAGGKSYLDLLRRREGDASDAPDAVVTPGTTEETAALLTTCSEHGIVVVPFGGGTSVVGGLTGMDPDDRPSIAVDLSRMASVQALDVPSSLVTVGPGMRGPALEEELAREGLTFGHLPQSWEFATVGGYAATRSAGQASTGVGRFDELVAGLTLATPSGVLEVGHPPATAAGPDLLGLALGSEGTLGVITELTLRVRPQAAELVLRGLVVPHVAGRAGRPAAAGAARPAARRRPAVRRRRDEGQPADGLRRRAPRPCAAACSTRGHGEGCLLVARLGGAARPGPRPAEGGVVPAARRRGDPAGPPGRGVVEEPPVRRARTCGTSSWTPACWWRRWRRRPPGRRCPPCTTPSAGPCASR